MRDPYFDKQDVQYLFDSAGVWIAFRIGRNVFDTVGKWVGWLPFENDATEVHSPKGLYLGHIYDDRFYRNSRYLFREAIEKAPKPGYFSLPTPPPFRPARAQLPIGCNDIRLSAHV